MEPDNTTQTVAGLLHGYPKSQAIYVAAKLDLAGKLVTGPLSAEELARATGAHAPALYRLLRALASEGIFAEGADGKFAMTPAAQCLREDAPNSQRAMALMLGEEHYRAWGELLYSIQTGEKGFDKVFGLPVFEFLSQNPVQGAIFDGAMTSIHGREAAPMLAAYNFSPLKVVADIGGGNGSTLIAILKRYPHLTGWLFDLPGVVERASKNFSEAGVQDRCKLEAGDFFQSIPAGADAYLFRHIIHDWNDEQCVTILSNCRKALRPGGKVLILESVIEPGNEPAFAKWLDLTMLVIPGGQERTAEEFRRLLDRAGLNLVRILPTAGGISILEAVAK